MSTKPRHTPGPWQHDELGIIYGRDGEPIQSGSEFVGGEPYANARLISLAPELLTWTKELLAHIERTQPDGFEGVKEHVRSLISRAEGGE